MKDESNVTFFRPYTREIDDKFKIGFDSAVEVSFPFEDKDKVDSETQANVLALKYIKAYVDYILAPTNKRIQIDHRGAIEEDGDEQVSES